MKKNERAKRRERQRQKKAYRSLHLTHRKSLETKKNLLKGTQGHELYFDLRE